MKANIVSKFCSTMDNNITVCRDTKEKISLKKEQWLYLKAGGDNINLDIVII